MKNAALVKALAAAHRALDPLGRRAGFRDAALLGCIDRALAAARSAVVLLAPRLPEGLDPLATAGDVVDALLEASSEAVAAFRDVAAVRIHDLEELSS